MYFFKGFLNLEYGAQHPRHGHQPLQRHEADHAAVHQTNCPHADVRRGERYPDPVPRARNERARQLLYDMRGGGIYFNLKINILWGSNSEPSLLACQTCAFTI